MAACDKCSFDYFQVIAEFYNNDTKSLAFLRSHRVLPSEIICPHFLLTVITVRISKFGAVGSLVLFLNLRSDGFVVFLFPIIKEHFLIIPILPRGKYYYLLITFLVTCGTTELCYRI